MRAPDAAAPDDETLRRRSMEYLGRHDITAVTGGTAEMVDAWRNGDPKRIIPALGSDAFQWPTIAGLRRLH